MKNFVALLLIVGLTPSASANENVRDGRPCMSGICIGDEISQLSGIKWSTATSMMGDAPVKNVKLGDVQVTQLAAQFASSAAPTLNAAAPYLIFGTFDSDAIPKLARVKGFCE